MSEPDAPDEPDGASDAESLARRSDAPLDQRVRLEREMGELPWSELVRHFARGVVVVVRADVDLIDAALRFVDDDATRVGEWLESGRIARASDDDARDWTDRAPDFLCVVAAPWVLVQERDRQSGRERG